MRSQLKLSLLIGGTIVVMLGLAIGHIVYKSGNTPVTDPVSKTPMSEMTASPADTVPSAENVSSQYQSEVQSLTNRLQKFPDDTTHLLRLAILYQDGHQPQKAITRYEHYLKLHPGNHQAWLDLTSCYGKISDWNKALATSKRLLDHFPDDPFGLYNLGAIYANMGQVKEARREWARIITLNTNPKVSSMASESLKKLDQQKSQQTGN